MKSLAELQAIRNRMIEQVNMRKDDNIDTRIVVGMATCGIAAGARPVMLEFVEELKRRGLENVTVAQPALLPSTSSTAVPWKSTPSAIRVNAGGVSPCVDQAQPAPGAVPGDGRNKWRNIKWI